jgi:hypothetical protein
MRVGVRRHDACAILGQGGAHLEEGPAPEPAQAPGRDLSEDDNDRLRAQAGTNLPDCIGGIASQKSNYVHAAAGMVAAFWISIRGGISE